MYLHDIPDLIMLQYTDELCNQDPTHIKLLQTEVRFFLPFTQSFIRHNQVSLLAADTRQG